jgi:Protein  of unknown function (DUF3018)
MSKKKKSKKVILDELLKDKKAFAKEARRQSRMLRNDPQEREILDWLEKIADRTGVERPRMTPEEEKRQDQLAKDWKWGIDTLVNMVAKHEREIEELKTRLQALEHKEKP